MLAQQRGLAIGRFRCADEMDGGVDRAEDAAHVVAAVDEHSAGFQVGAGVKVGLVLNHAHGVADLDQALGHFCLGAFLRPFFDGRDEVVHIELATDALTQVARVFYQVFASDEPPEVFPFLRASSPGQNDITVLGL